MKTRGGNKAITKENKDKARELLKKIGIKATIEVVIPPPPPPAATAPPPPTAAAAAPPPPAAATLPPAPKTPPATAAPPPPAAIAPAITPALTPAAGGKGPPPPPPPPPKIAISTDLLNELDDTPEEKAAKEKAAKVSLDAAKKGSMVEEMMAQQEKAPKTAGTKDGKTLNVYKEKYIDNLNYRKNYKTELEKVLEDEKVSQDNKDKAAKLLKDFNDELIRRAKEFLVKDTSLETLYPVRNEYKEFKKEYYDPYMKKMKQYQEETKQKFEVENEKLNQYKEMNKQENRKTLSPEQKKKLTKKLDETIESVKKLKELVDKINDFSGLK
jgi:hypothetical protein